MDEITIDLPVTPGVDLLQRVPLFRTLGFTETMALSGICAIEKKLDGQAVIHQDSLGMALYIMKEGEAVVRRRDPVTGQTMELATIKTGDLFGEMSLIDDQLASADVVAKGDVELLVIPRREFEKLLASNDKLAVKVYRCFCAALSERLRKANSKLAEARAKMGG
jgi:CRP/FNR family transcriptional regulator, cyclic AMP receptor protein